MRKGTSLLIVVLLVLVVLPTAAFAQPEYDPIVVDLIAGQYADAGDVLVWNDADSLYVEYVAQNGWCLMETHLQVATELDGIPQRNGNPVPGQFDYKGEHDCDSSVLYTIPYPGNELVIAAHAVVAEIDGVGLTTDETFYIRSVAGVPVYGPIDHYAAVDSSDWGASNPAVETWLHPSWPVPVDSYGTPVVPWISTAYYVEDPVNSSWRRFHHAFETPEGAVMCRADFSNIGVTSDNAEEFYFNGVLIGSDGEVQGDSHDDHEWATFQPYETGWFYDLPDVLTVDFIMRNYSVAGGTTTSNPTGIIYKGKITCKIEVEPETETAWGDGELFPGRNWATYFTYTWQ